MGHHKFEIYRDDAGEFRWRLKAANGRIVADSSEGYRNKDDLQATLHGLIVAIQGMSFEVVDNA